jgi:hypothetical protein
LQALAAKFSATSGGQYQMEIADGNLRRLLGLCESGELQLISINPIRASLEDYFEGLSQRPGNGRPREQEVGAP